MDLRRGEARIYNSGFNGNCLKPKMTFFVAKGVFGMGDKWVLQTMFLECCALLKALLLDWLQQNTATAAK